MQPRLARGIVVAAVDGFVEHVRVVAAETRHFLLDAFPCRRHQLRVAPIPELVAMRQSTLHAAARRLDDVFVEYLGVDRRQLAVPVDDA